MPVTLNNNMNIKQAQDKAIVLESNHLRVVVEPQNGGKIRSFFSKETATEYLYQDTRTTFSHKGFSFRDISGFDECFPTVAPCVYVEGPLKGHSLGDHGLLWQDPWEVSIQDNSVKMGKGIPSLDCHFERICRLEDTQSLRLDYRITNYSKGPIEYLYSAHPLIGVAEDTRMEIPKNSGQVYLALASENIDLPKNSWLDYSVLDQKIVSVPYSFKNESFVKFFIPQQPTARPAIRQLNTGEALLLDYDQSQLPYLGVLVFQGYDAFNDGTFKNMIFLGLEPTTGVGDDLPTCHSTNTVATLLPGQEVRFWITMTLEQSVGR